MAQAKKTTGSSKKTGSRARSGSARSSKGSKQVDTGIRLEAILLLLFCVVLVLFLCMIGVIKGSFGPAVRKVMLGVFGISAYLMPIVGFLAICFRIANKGNRVATLKLTAGAVLLFMCGILVCYMAGMKVDEISEGGHIFKDLYEFQGGGGVLFGLPACLLNHIFGKVGTIILTILFIIICLVLLTEKSLLRLLRNGGQKIYGSVKAGREYLEDNLQQDDEEEEEEAELKAAVRKKRKVKPQEEPEEDPEAARQEKVRSRKQQLAARRKEEEERKRLKEQLDDERILKQNQPRERTINFDLTSAASMNRQAGKDEMHEIMLNLPEDETENSKEYMMPERTGSNHYSPNEMTEVIYIYEEGQEPGSVLTTFENSRDYRMNNMQEIVNTTSRYINEMETPARQVPVEELQEMAADQMELPHQNFAPDTETAEGRNDAVYDEAAENSRGVLHAKAEENSRSTSRDAAAESSRSALYAETAEERADATYAAPAEKTGAFVPDVSQMPEPVTERSHKQVPVQPLPTEKPRLFTRKKYQIPPLTLLRPKDKNSRGDSDQHLKETALRLQQTLKTFGVTVTVTDISQGPSVTRYELQLGEGIKVNKIVNLSDDIKLNLAAQDIRIEAPIPGKAAVGIEIPNKETSEVLIRELLDSGEFQSSASKMTFAVGKDISGKTIVADIAKMPHMLIAGATGSGKSVCINTLIMSILYKASPEEVKLIMIDPKVVELSVYNGIPHLMIPVVTDPKKASAALQWAVNEMTKRYKLFADLGVRDLKGYNSKIAPLVNENDPEAPVVLPQIIVIVDELADLMMVASKEVEEAICRLAQLARAAGIHLIIATQRPSVDVITGLIKANMPSRVAFKVTSGVDSRTILDMVGAEKLLGKGDMLFFPQGYSKPLRVQGAFVSDAEVEKVVDFLKQNAGDNVYDEEVEKQISGMNASGSGMQQSGEGQAGRGYDDYFVEACRFVTEKEKASSGMLQRVFKIGFNRAGRIVDQMEEAGVVGPEEGTKPRKVLMTREELEIFLEDNGFI